MAVAPPSTPTEEDRGERADGAGGTDDTGDTSQPPSFMLIDALLESAEDVVVVVLFRWLRPAAAAALARSSARCLRAALDHADIRGFEGYWRVAWPMPIVVRHAVSRDWRRAMVLPVWLLPDDATSRSTTLFRVVAEEVSVDLSATRLMNIRPPSGVACTRAHAPLLAASNWPTWRVVVQWFMGTNAGTGGGIGGGNGTGATGRPEPLAKLVVHIDAMDETFGVCHGERIPRKNRVLAHGLSVNDDASSPGKLFWPGRLTNSASAMVLVETRADGSIFLKVVPKLTEGGSALSTYADVLAERKCWPEIRITSDDEMRGVLWLHSRRVRSEERVLRACVE